MEIAPDLLVHQVSGVISNPPILEHKRKMACHAKTQPLFPQMDMLKVDLAYAQ